MRRWQGILGMALLAASFGVKAHAQTTLWDPAQHGVQPTDLTSNVTVGSTVSIDGQSGREFAFNASWARIGQHFSSPVNWASHAGYSFTIKNLDATPVTVGIRFFRDAALVDNIRTSIALAPSQSLQCYVDTTSWSAHSQAQFMNRPLPVFPSYYRHLATNVSAQLSAVYGWQLYYPGTGSARVAITPLKGHLADSSYAGRVDGYGQLTPRHWDTKIAADTSFGPLAIQETGFLSGNLPHPTSEGATTLPAQTATGRWRTYKAASGKWYFVRPNGKLFWSFGLDQLSDDRKTIVQGRESLFQDLPLTGEALAQFYGSTVKGGVTYRTYDFYRGNLFSKYGTDWQNSWKNRTVERMRSWGFNTVGSGSDNQFFAAGSPFVMTLNTTSYPKRLTTAQGASFPDVYASDFRTAFENQWRGYVQWNSTNTNLMGFYVDGEMQWGLNAGTIRQKYHIPIAALARTNALSTKGAFVTQLQGKYGTISSFNQVYGTSFSSWDILKVTALSLSDAQLATPGVQADLSLLLKNYAYMYYVSVRNGLRNIGSTSLYLGSRDMPFMTPSEVIQSAATMVDVLSFTYYELAGSIPWNQYNAYNKPIMISEFSFAGRDQNSAMGFVNEGANACDQNERATKAAAYLNAALTNKNCVGAHWFCYVDQPLTGHPSGENYAFGMVDIADTPYYPLVNAFRALSGAMYSVRGI